MLNKETSAVRRIEPQDYGHEDRKQFRDDDGPTYNDHYRSVKNRHNNYQRDDWYDDYRRDDDHRNDYHLDHRNREYSPRNDRRPCKGHQYNDN